MEITPLSLIHKIKSDEPMDLFRRLEAGGDGLLSFARWLCGRTYFVYIEKGVSRLKSPEDRSWHKPIRQVAAIALLPITILSALAGALLKKIALARCPKLKDKYALASPLIHARSEANFAGRLPSNPFTPNCVNSQQESLWGRLYNVEPIGVPEHLASSDPLGEMDQMIKALMQQTPCPLIAKLTEKRDCYRHYEFTVKIPKLGTFIDDVDLWYDAKRHVIDVRSASRRGFRDALSLNFSRPGANKQRVELLREAFILRPLKVSSSSGLES